jgi:hypothetical protein
MTRFVDSVYLRGAGLSRQLIESCTKAELNGSVTEINQLSLTFTDPGWALLKSGIFSINASVDVEDFAMEISAIATGEDAGIENVTLKCRSRIIRKLKNRRGTRVLKNSSASDFVISECKAVGAKYNVQATGKRKQVARDVAKAGQQEVDNPPSSWTTFNRLADEEGYICFETAGVIHFGRPSWFISGTSATAQWFIRYKQGNDDDNRMYSVPSGQRSADSPGQTVSFDMHTNSLTRFRPGVRFNIVGLPTFETTYLCTQFDIDMLDPMNLVSITGSIANNPDASLTTGNQARQGTRLASDLVYWVRKQLGDRYVTQTQVGLGSTNPNVFDGDELAQWAAVQVGSYLPDGADAQIAYCESFGTTLTVSSAQNKAGAILWRSGHIGISLGKGQIVESVNGKVGIRSGGATSRYTKAGLVPGILY